MLRFAIPLIAVAVASAPMAASARDFRSLDNDQPDRQIERVQSIDLYNREGATEPRAIQNWDSSDWQFRNVGYDPPGTAKSREEWRRQQERQWDRDGYDRPGTVESRREWQRQWERNGERDRYLRGGYRGRYDNRWDYRDRYNNRWDYRDRYNNRWNDRDRYDNRWDYRRNRNTERRIIIFPSFLF